MRRGKVSLDAGRRTARSGAAWAGDSVGALARRLRHTQTIAVGQRMARRAAIRARDALTSSRLVATRAFVTRTLAFERFGFWYTLVFGMVAITAFLLAFDRFVGRWPNPGMLYVLTIAYITFRWGWRYGVIATGVQTLCAFVMFYPPLVSKRGMSLDVVLYMLTMLGGSAAIIALIELAKRERRLATREAGRYAVLTHLGEALASATDESQALRLVTRTVATCTSSDFAGVALAAAASHGPTSTYEDDQLYLFPELSAASAAALARGRAEPLCRCGPLGPLYNGKPIFLDDLALRGRSRPGEEQRCAGVCPRCPLGEARSVIAAPLIDPSGAAHGAIALGHRDPRHYTQDDLALLMGLARLAQITAENKRLLQTAQAQALELDVIFEHVGDAISLVDARGDTVRENQAARRLRHAMTQGVWPDDEGKSAPPSPHARETLHALPIVIVDPAGVTREYEVYRAALAAPDETQTEEVPSIAGAVVVYRDVTETRRLIEERRARREAEARRALLQRVVDQVPAGVFLVSGRRARLVLGNSVAMRMFGAECPVGMTVAEFMEESGMRVLRLDGTVVATEELATLRTLRSGESLRSVQALMRQPNGYTLPILINTVALDGVALSDSDITGDEDDRAALVVMQDVSALKEVERLKDDFIAVAAHELKNPVMEIKGNVDTLLVQSARGNGRPLDPWQSEMLESVAGGVAKLDQITRDLLDVSRIQAGLLELRREPHDLVALVRRVVKSRQSAAPNHIITFQTSNPHVVAEIDLRRIEQVTANLIGNAVKYSPDTNRIEVTVEERENEAHLVVTDHGIGIPRDQQPRVFERFVRAENARERHIEGHGLGLYLSRELVERHGGHIWFDSTPGVGTTFHVALPLFQE